METTNHILDKKSLEYIRNLLNFCNIPFDNFNVLNGMIVSRDIFLRDDLYKSVMESDIFIKLKQQFSSSKITMFHKNAELKQKHPLLNFVRQLLRMIYYKMTPIRKSNGYDKTGKKLYLRMYKIEKMRVPEHYIVNVPIV